MAVNGFFSYGFGKWEKAGQGIVTLYSRVLTWFGVVRRGFPEELTFVRKLKE